MQGEWTQAIIMLAAIFGVFVWLRNDMKENREAIAKLRTDMQGDNKQLRIDMQGEMQQFRDEMRGEMQQFRDEMRGEMQQFRGEMRGEMQQFRDEMQRDMRRLETKVDGLDSRLRAVESEQSRVVGLLEGLGLAGALPDRES